MNKYFVCYIKGNDSNYEKCTSFSIFETDQDLDTEKGIVEAVKYLEDTKNDGNPIVLINWKKLKE